ncbi:hypothetical protein OGATHE_002002 [Ogataea polymorpha]|uniref:Uncharacterized protein n=1 Tax=Ogataea polymorpha TaxID=460523 RepID=A0A9P8PM70_9ASCO|nr:hypothetical protein OGATHE_002002 [Ogataea polymorpha]
MVSALASGSSCDSSSRSLRQATARSTTASSSSSSRRSSFSQTAVRTVCSVECSYITLARLMAFFRTAMLASPIRSHAAPYRSLISSGCAGTVLSNSSTIESRTDAYCSTSRAASDCFTVGSVSSDGSRSISSDRFLTALFLDLVRGWSSDLTISLRELS